MTNEIFLSNARSNGDLAGVYEHTDDTGYFYLYDNRVEGRKVLGAIHILDGNPPFGVADLSIRWDAEQKTVGLFIGGDLWAAFDTSGTRKFGGQYTPSGRPQVPEDIAIAFAQHS